MSLEIWTSLALMNSPKSWKRLILGFYLRKKKKLINFKIMVKSSLFHFTLRRTKSSSAIITSERPKPWKESANRAAFSISRPRLRPTRSAGASLTPKERSPSTTSAVSTLWSSRRSLPRFSSEATRNHSQTLSGSKSRASQPSFRSKRSAISRATASLHNTFGCCARRAEWSSAGTRFRTWTTMTLSAKPRAECGRWRSWCARKGFTCTAARAFTARRKW